MNMKKRPYRTFFTLRIADRLRQGLDAAWFLW